MKTQAFILSFAVLALLSCKKETRTPLAPQAPATVSATTIDEADKDAFPAYFRANGYSYYFHPQFIGYRLNNGGC
ncbi:MAG: hypothetical protein ACXVNO_00870 [Bacteroidia bacterium]